MQKIEKLNERTPLSNSYLKTVLKFLLGTVIKNKEKFDLGAKLYIYVLSSVSVYFFLIPALTSPLNIQPWFWVFILILKNSLKKLRKLQVENEQKRGKKP